MLKCRPLFDAFDCNVITLIIIVCADKKNKIISTTTSFSIVSIFTV